VNIGCTRNKSAALTRIALVNVASRGNCPRVVFSANSRAGSSQGHVLPPSANLSLAKPNFMRADSYINRRVHSK
jgi:hypothetical protein